MATGKGTQGRNLVGRPATGPRIVLDARYVSMSKVIRGGGSVRIVDEGDRGLANPSKVPLSTPPRALVSRGQGDTKASAASPGGWVTISSGGLPSLGKRR